MCNLGINSKDWSFYSPCTAKRVPPYFAAKLGNQHDKQELQWYYGNLGNYTDGLLYYTVYNV